MRSKPLALLLQQIRSRPEHRVLTSRARAAGAGCAPEALEFGPASRIDGSWTVAVACSLGESSIAWRALGVLRDAGRDPLGPAETARRLLALLGEALRAGSPSGSSARERAAARVLVPELARAAYGIGAFDASMPIQAPSTAPAPSSAWAWSPTVSLVGPLQEHRPIPRSPPNAAANTQPNIAPPEHTADVAPATAPQKPAPQTHRNIRRGALPRARSSNDIGWRQKLAYRHPTAWGLRIGTLGVPSVRPRGGP